MKKLSILKVGLLVTVFVLVFFVAPVIAQWTPVYTNQITIEWDAVTTLETGDAIPDGDSVAYDVVIKEVTGDEQQTLGRTTELTYTITVPSEGEWAVGVIAVRLCEDGTEILSDVNWSTENGDSTPNPFSVIYRIAPSCTKNLRTQ